MDAPSTTHDTIERTARDDTDRTLLPIADATGIPVGALIAMSESPEDLRTYLRRAGATQDAARYRADKWIQQVRAYLESRTPEDCHDATPAPDAQDLAERYRPYHDDPDTDAAAEARAIAESACHADPQWGEIEEVEWWRNAQHAALAWRGQANLRDGCAQDEREPLLPDWRRRAVGSPTACQRTQMLTESLLGAALVDGPLPLALDLHGLRALHGHLRPASSERLIRSAMAKELSLRATEHERILRPLRDAVEDAAERVAEAKATIARAMQEECRDAETAEHRFAELRWWLGDLQANLQWAKQCFTREQAAQQRLHDRAAALLARDPANGRHDSKRPWSHPLPLHAQDALRILCQRPETADTMPITPDPMRQYLRLHPDLAPDPTDDARPAALDTHASRLPALACEYLAPSPTDGWLHPFAHHSTTGRARADWLPWPDQVVPQEATRTCPNGSVAPSWRLACHDATNYTPRDTMGRARPLRRSQPSHRTSTRYTQAQDGIWRAQRILHRADTTAPVGAPQTQPLSADWVPCSEVHGNTAPSTTLPLLRDWQEPLSHISKVAQQQMDRRQQWKEADKGRASRVDGTAPSLAAHARDLHQTRSTSGSETTDALRYYSYRRRVLHPAEVWRVAVDYKAERKGSQYAPTTCHTVSQTAGELGLTTA